MNPAIRTNGQVAVSIFRESALVGQAVIDTISWRGWEQSRPNARSPRGLHAALRVTGTLHRALYVRTSGRIGGKLRGGPVLLLTTTGRKTGRKRTRPLSYLRDGDNLVLIASAGGAPRHPAWYLNLQSNPRVRVQQGGTTRTMLARSADRSERARLWQGVLQQYPVAAGYQHRTGREIPVVILQPVRAAEPLQATNPRLWTNDISLVPARINAAA
ncbi:MAG: nitroreductase family deazaflavin-dependent oxidoreductase [Nitrolancea sp.]